MAADGLLVGLDGGGTWTRAVVVCEDGTLRGYAVSGGCNPESRTVDECVRNAATAIREALTQVGARGADVRGLVAGIAGLTHPGGADWAQAIADACGMPCRGHFTGDNVVAQVGAFGGGPGIVFCSGTGSIVFGVTQTGREVCNYDFGHYAPSGAWWLGRLLLTRLAAHEAGPADQQLVREVLSRLECASLEALREALLTGRDMPVPQLAPLVTAAAMGGAPLARALCDQAADELARGVRLLGPCFEALPVAVAPVGSVAASPYITAAVARALATVAPSTYTVQEPLFPPVVGAAVMALRRHGVADAVQQCRKWADRPGTWAAR